jgi:hypothetical protein
MATPDPKLDQLLLQASIDFYDGVLAGLAASQVPLHEMVGQIEANKLAAERTQKILGRAVEKKA